MVPQSTNPRQPSGFKQGKLVNEKAGAETKRVANLEIWCPLMMHTLQISGQSDLSRSIVTAKIFQVWVSRIIQLFFGCFESCGIKHVAALEPRDQKCLILWYLETL